VEPQALNRSGLARRYGVDRSAVGRALARAAEAARRDPAAPRPPQPLNPGEPTEVFDVAAFDAFWAQRPGPGRPASPPANTTGSEHR
jgi:hypothetical protein